MANLRQITREQVKSPELLQRYLSDIVTRLEQAQKQSDTLAGRIGKMALDGKLTTNGIDSKLVAQSRTVLSDIQSGSAAQVELGLDQIATKLSNLNATVNPTANDDNSKGYGVGSIWINHTTVPSEPETIFMCADDTTTSASWIQIG